MQDVLKEQNKLQKQLENAEREFLEQKNNLASLHAEEKKILIEVQSNFSFSSFPFAYLIFFFFFN